MRACPPASFFAFRDRMHCDAKKQVLRCYSSNLIPTTAHVDLTWSMGFDLSPLDTIASKKRRHAQVIPEKRPTVFAHDPKTP